MTFPSNYPSKLAAGVLAFLGVAGGCPEARAAAAEVNPFECQGRAEALQADRSIGQVEGELAKLMRPGALPTASPRRAVMLCVIAELKERVGDADAADYYARAIKTNPDEPGLELFLGNYYGGARGAGGPVIEMAEKHYYRALDKLEKLRQAGRNREYHEIVEDRVRKGLLLLYQKDGIPLLPWKAYPQHSSGYLAPGLSLGIQATFSADTRDSPGASDTSGFTAEAGLFAFRTGEQPERFELFEIARNPYRQRLDAQLRLRHTYVGAIDLAYARLDAKQAAITQFDVPETKNDIEVQEVGLAYERVVPLYPLFDLRVAGAVKRVHRVGVVEFHPDCAQDFNVYEAKPSLSRFISSDKLTLGATFAYMDIAPIDCSTLPAATPDYLKVRGRRIAAVNFEYAFYSPVLLPALHLASLRSYRTPTRGWYVFGGYVNDNEVFGDHRTVNETFYAGSRLEGPGPFDIGITESLYVSSGTEVSTDGTESPANELSATILRSNLVVARRLVNPDETPGVPPAWGPFAGHSLNWVIPASFDKVLAGRPDFENFRVGSELWWQLFVTGLGGPAVLVSGGYEYQYFYRFDKHVHNLKVTLRTGWREL